jgi:hypothetical protein
MDDRHADRFLNGATDPSIPRVAGRTSAPHERREPHGGPCKRSLPVGNCHLPRASIARKPVRADENGS